MNFFRQSVTSCAIAILLGSTSVMAANDALIPIQQQWAVCQYQQSGKGKESCLETLSTQAEAASAKEPFRADLLIWSAIVKSTWAGAKGGLGALGLVKEAKAKLELALKQDPKALDGSAYTSLGSLYYQVPGWPVGFGDDEKAEQLLKQALAINPDGIDPNFFWIRVARPRPKPTSTRRWRPRPARVAKWPMKGAEWRSAIGWPSYKTLMDQRTI